MTNEQILVRCRICDQSYYVPKKGNRAMTHYCSKCHHPYQSEKACSVYAYFGLLFAIGIFICWPPAIDRPTLSGNFGEGRVVTSIWNTVEQLQINGSRWLSNFLLIVAIVFPLGKAFNLLAYYYFPPRYRTGRRLVGRVYYWIRLGLFIPARFWSPDIVVLILTFIAFTGHYDIRMSWERGGWIFGLMFLCSIISTEFLKRAR